MTRSYVLPMPYDRPPLTLNGRAHWRLRDRISRELRDWAAVTVRARRIPALGYARVQMVYTPPDNRRRDVDNLVPTSKAAVDALVRAGVWEDDTPRHLDHLMPTILAGNKLAPHRLVLTIEETQ